MIEGELGICQGLTAHQGEADPLLGGSRSSGHLNCGGDHTSTLTLAPQHRAPLRKRSLQLAGEDPPTPQLLLHFSFRSKLGHRFLPQITTFVEVHPWREAELKRIGGSI